MKAYSTSMLIVICLTSSLFAVNAQVMDLRCDYRVAPLGVDRADPVLSWRMEADQRDAAQSAYRIQAALSPESLDQAGLWDSGWVTSSRSTGIPYAGKALTSTQRVYWRVQIKDEKGAVCPWSAPSWFETGLWTDSDWRDARWISCTRDIVPQVAPAEVMGPWIAPSHVAPAQRPAGLRYDLTVTLPNTPVVYAGTWWAAGGEANVWCQVNGEAARTVKRQEACKFTDFGFLMKSGENLIELVVEGARESCPVTFGMRIVLADGTERIVRSSEQWQVQIGKEQQGVQTVCDYGQAPLGQAEIYAQAPLAAAWYKRDFTVDKPVAQARLYVCGLGYNEPFINGQKVRDHVLDPGQTDYETFALYQAFDVGVQIKPGDNALAILLGDGWYNQDRGFNALNLGYGKPGLRAFLSIRYRDGSTTRIVSSDAWHWKASEIQMSNVYLGDHVDFRQGHDEWQRPGTPSGWQPVQEVSPLSPKLIAQDFPPMRQIRTISPVKTWPIGAKTWIVDLGQNISGWIALDVNEPAGTVIRIRCTEMLQPDGRHLASVPHSFWWCHGAPQHHELICDGKPHSWQPRFSYHGFRYAEIHGLSHAPQPGQIRGIVVHTDTPVSATFASSDPLLDRMFQMGIQTHLNNLHSILEDCPHREKCMWGGDLHASWATGFYALNAATFYRQVIRLYYSPPFSKSGVPGNVGVGKRLSTYFSDFSWAVSPLFLTWRLYQMDGDLQPAQEHYDNMLHFLRYFEKNAPNLIPTQAAHGDHAFPPDIKRVEQDKHLIAALNFFAAATRFADLAEALGKPADAAWSRHLAGRIRTSVLSKYYDAQAKTFGNGTQDSLALAFRLPDPDQRDAVARSLARVYQDNGKQFDGGFMSYQIYPQLAEHGEVDLALAMLRNPDYPGLAWSIKNFDATTVWEKFSLDPVERQDRSLDHHAMNHASAWLLTHLAGIQAHPRTPGFQHILLSPYVPRDLEWVRATVTTAYGRIESAWKQSDAKVSWTVTIPPNCRAEVRFPDSVDAIRIDGQRSPRYALGIELAAGTYRLEWQRTR